MTKFLSIKFFVQNATVSR